MTLQTARQTALLTLFAALLVLLTPRTASADMAGILHDAAQYSYCSACQDADCMMSTGCGSCWAMSDYLCRRFADEHIQSRIIQYDSGYTWNHRSVQYWDGDWVDVPYKAYGINYLFNATSYKGGMFEFKRCYWCTPTTCAAQGAECGSIPDGCGGTLGCGNCNGAGTCVDLHCNWYPKGNLDKVTCESLGGWAQDGNTPQESVEVRVAFDGADFDAAQIVLPADDSREDLCSALGSCNHAFESRMPVSLRDSQKHTVSILAKDTQGGPAVEIAGSPKSFTCEPPALPLSPSQGLLRPLGSAQVFQAWKFSALWDVATYPDKALVDFTRAAPLSSKPVLAKAEGGKELWLLDSSVRRLIADNDVFKAWRFDSKAVQAQKPTELTKWREGTDLSASPFLLKGSGSAVFLLDSYFDYEGRAPGEPVLRSSENDGSDQTFRSDQAGESGVAGCACRTGAPGRGPQRFGIGLVGLGLMIALRKRSEKRAE